MHFKKQIMAVGSFTILHVVAIAIYEARNVCWNINVYLGRN